ncbi:PspC domain-containing protein [Prolixibacteraceae bacterium Z1-6]|uniref:PspC domain-containing protein n=1 Tax=Draconibacterium aestuarii TaxID=2998507 RepID=A0A9X3F485_9BACT|nr:PspC domain-containing protein [Prolixibacteraceae bacterium Z1-6]
MKKTFTINISGSVFHIEEDAYEVLQKYMMKLKQHFGNSEEGKEITADIEARIAELFIERSTNEKNVVTLEWVNKVIETMGTFEDYTDEDSEAPAQEQTKRKRRLYRDPEQSVLGGVCSGLAAYFNMDIAILRLIVVLLFFVTSGGALLAYIILWIAVPKAVNTSQRLEMRGEEVTVKNIEKFIKDEVNSVKESYNKFRKSGFFSKKRESQT